MAISVSYYGNRKPSPAVKPERVIKLPSNAPLDKLPFGQKNPVDWMTGKHLFRLNAEQMPVMPEGKVFPVALVGVGGEAGDAETPATWHYDVFDLDNGKRLLESANPVSEPHRWSRPERGRVEPATYGYACYVEHKDGTKTLVLGWINEVAEAEAPVMGDADIAAPTHKSIETKADKTLQLYDFDAPDAYEVPAAGDKPKVVLRDASGDKPEVVYGDMDDMATSIIDEFYAGEGIAIDVPSRTISIDKEQLDEILHPGGVPPPCGHPGNLPGGGEDEGHTEHPGDQPGGSAGGVDAGDPTDHPGDSPTPPSSGECE